MEIPAKDLNYPNETLQVLKAIHAEQQKQGKHLRNIYQIQLIMFAAVLAGVAVAFGYRDWRGRIRFAMALGFLAVLG